MEKRIRELAIELLDNEDGLNEKAYNILSDMLRETGSKDICNAVNTSEGYSYIGEDDAEEFREGLRDWNKEIP